MKSIIMSAISAVILLIMTGCSGGGSDSPTATTITVVDGYVKDGNLTDATGARASYSSNGRYTFTGLPQYPLYFTGGRLEDTNTSFDINMTAQEGSSVVSPITTFLENDSILLGKLANLDFGVSTFTGFQTDYVNSNNSNIAKLSQLLYIALKDPSLLTAFKIRLAGSSPANFNDIAILLEADINATISSEYAIGYRALLAKIKTLTGNVSTFEAQLDSTISNVGLIVHNDIGYGTVISPNTGRIWLDRNLGASKVCEDSNDTACFGGWYQWGRETDGHEEHNSSVSTTHATAIDNVGSTHIDPGIHGDGDWTTVDGNGLLREIKWAKTDGTSICPIGFRVPTTVEFITETASLSNSTDAFNSFLKIPFAADRVGTSLYYINNSGIIYMWTGTPGDNGAGSFVATDNHAEVREDDYWLSRARSVRCIKD